MNKFSNILKIFITPPIFEGDEDKTRIAGLLNTILFSLVVLLVTINVILTIVSLATNQAPPNPFVSIIATTIFIGLIILMRLGFVRQVSLLLSFVISGVITLSLARSESLMAVTSTGYIIAIITAGLLSGGWSVLVLVLFNLLCLGGLSYAASQGLTPSQPLAEIDLITFGAFFAISAFLLELASRSIRESLANIRQKENAQLEANQELRNLQAELEQRVADRTKALSTVAEISTSASTSLETDKLLQQIVDLAKESFELYHAHIYLLDESGTSLVLTSGAGEAGKQMVAKGHSIPLDREQSLVARAAREGKGVTVNDVTAAPDFLPNPLLPDTRSELAVPMMAGKDIIGVFDVQSDIVGRFTEADIAVQTTLASQVASAVQNARSYTELQRNQSQLSEALNISRLANWEYDVEKDLFTFNDQFYSIFRTSVEHVGSYKLPSAEYARLFVHPEDAPLVGSEIQKVLESKERYFKTELEHRIIFSDGEIGYIAVKVNAERDENGKILRFYGANQDVTERRQLEEQNRKRASQQETISAITQRIQNAATIESALQVAARELGHALGMKPTAVTIASKLHDDKKSAS